MADNNGAMGWDDAIEKDGDEYVILPEGDYIFTVTSFERGRFQGGDKIPACNEAVLTLTIEHDGEKVNIIDRLKLHKSLEWKLAAFFRAIGQKKHGERLVMDWTKVPGAEGRAHIKPRKYKDSNGEEKEINNIAKYIDYDPDKMSDPFASVIEEDLPFDTKE
jgi:hypothetical protein